MSISKRSFMIFLVGAGLTLILAGLSPLLLVRAQEATTEPPVETVEPAAESALEAEGTPEAVYHVSGEPIEVTGDNSYCMVCHNQPWDTVTLGDGSIQNLFVNPATIAASVHGANSSEGTFGCVDCHGEDAFPHNLPSPSDDRAYTLYSVSICAQCHVDEVTELESGLHEQAILAGDHEAAVCTDCHGAHDVQPVVEEPELIAGVCGDCHTNTLVEWRASEHVDIGPLGCATCHSPHSQRLRAGNTPDELCINCHEEAPELFVHAQHLGSESPVTCVDCHMYTEPHLDTQLVGITTLDAPTGHSMELDSTPCNTCHEELVVSGEWSQLIANRDTVAQETAILEPTPDPLEQAEEVTAASNDSLVQLIQGLVLGLGFGVTFATVIIARGYRTRHTPVESARTHEPTHGEGA